MKVPYFVPWINDEDRLKVLATLKQRWLTNGPILKKFESTFSTKLKTKYSIGVGSATHALHLSLKALGIGKGDEVIVPTFTFAATLNSVLYCGAKPVLADIDKDTFNINSNEIKKKITKNTKAVIIVHYGGQACDIDKILAITKNHKLSLVEDCAHALGSKFQNKFCGSFGITGCFSFYPTKIITTGEGGMVVTNNNTLSKKINSLRSHSLSISANLREKQGIWRYDIDDLGFNYRLDEIRSSLGLSQLKRLSQINKKRIKIAQTYDKLLSKISGLITPKISYNRNHIYHLYTIRLTKDYHMTRDELFLKLKNKEIGASVQYLPLHLMSYYKKSLKIKGKFPNAELLKNQVISLPIFPEMTNKQIEYVVENLR